MISLIFVQVICLVVLFVFSIKLRGVDDGFNIGKELQVSIYSMAIFMIVGLLLSFKFPNVLGTGINIIF